MADKKITELPFIDTLSGSLVGTNSPLQNTVIPIVLRGTTNQINIENFSKFVTQYSAHTGSAGNIFTGPQTINNNVTINGRLTVREVVAEYETASILFSTGSTKLGDEITDRHEFTGSTNITGSFIVNGANLTDFSASNSTLFTNYSSSVSESISSYSSSNAIISENYSASNSTTFTNLSSSNSTTFTNLSSSNSTTFTNLSSSNSTLFTNYSSSVSESISSYSSSNSTTFTNLSSSNSTTFTNYSSSTADSINGLSLGIGTELARVYQTTASLNVQTGSQNSLNTSLGLITSSIYGEITSFNSVFQRIGSTTSSMNTQSGSQDLVNLGISTYTGSQNVINASVDAHILKQATQTGSQDLVNYNISIVTSSIDAHILGISIYTASANTTNTSIDAHILAQSIQTASQDLVNLGISSVTGSLIGITNGLMAFTAALDNTYATDAQLYELYHATASLNTQTGSQDLVNLGISTFTGSIRSEVGLIEAYTASLKGAAIVSSSQQITNLGFVTSSQSASFNFIGFNTSAGVSVGVGQLAWNNSDGTLDLGMKGGNVVQQIGQEIFYEVRNDTGIQIPNGTAVFASGVTAGSGRITAAPYTADGSIREVRFLGLATENISTGVNGFVTHFGYVRGLDTRGDVVSSIAVGDETWAVGNILYVHPTVAGKLTNVKPEHAITVAIIITRHQSVGVLFVRPSSGGHLEDIHDILINTGSLTNGQVLSYNSTSGLWVNTNKLTGSYGIQGTLELNGDILGNVPLNTFTGSLRSEVNGIEAYTASLKGAIEVSGQNVNVLGSITAQQFNVTYVSSSVMYQSGSTKFGNSGDDKHEFTGSVDVLGSGVFSSTIRSNATNGLALGSIAGYRRLQYDNALSTFGFLTDGNARANIEAAAGAFIAPNNVVGTLLIQGGKEEGGFGETNSRLDFGSNDPSVAETGGIKIGGRISSVIENANGAHVGMAFSTYQQGRTPDLREEVRITNTGDLTLNYGNLVVASGKGIDFSATSNGSGTTSSELLNDYEEGTWTGTLKGSVSDPTTPVTATGYYTKVGNKVFATIAINNATTTGASGIVSVSGLPFTSAATNNSQGSVMSTFYDFDGGTSLVALLGSSTTNVFIMTSGDDADWNDVLHTVGSGRSLRFSITYFV
jgi:hypothetical protein